MVEVKLEHRSKYFKQIIYFNLKLTCIVGNGASSPISSASSSCPGKSTWTNTARFRISSKRGLPINLWNIISTRLYIKKLFIVISWAKKMHMDEFLYHFHTIKLTENEKWLFPMSWQVKNTVLLSLSLCASSMSPFWKMKKNKN